MTLPKSLSSRWPTFAALAGSGLLLACYARGGYAWPLGFVALMPWLWSLNRASTWTAALLRAWAMSIVYVLAVFGWFAVAVGSFTGLGTPLAWLSLLLLAPLLQPQWLALALVRQGTSRRYGPVLGALAGACAWVSCEWCIPKLLGDTLGHGLADAERMRQIADLGGAAGITWLLILVNEAILLALTRRRHGLRELAPPLALAALIPALMAGYGEFRLSALQASAAEPAPALRIGMVQASIVDYERLRRELGTYAVVRQILDTHFGLSRAAVEHHGVDALLWSETVYPTTFGHPRSEDGAALDREILDFVSSAGVALVFGTYDRDDAGEYNAAAFVQPHTGLLGYYRKTHPFPLTEYVPAWLDSGWLRGWLPWLGSWQPGNGARVFPLRAADGRELQVLPLICLDDVRPDLAIAGARLGAQAIVGLSNDAWFSADPQGARLHLAVAAFRSIETRLPQLRVTSNGYSAFIDPSGAVLARTALGDRAVLAGEVPVRDPPGTWMVRWGDWVGGAALVLLLLLAAHALMGHWLARAAKSAADPGLAAGSAPYHADVAVLTPRWRWLAAALRLTAALGLLALALRMLLRDGLQVNSLTQIQLYLGAVLLPLLASWAISRRHAAQAQLSESHLILRQRGQRIEIPLNQIAKIRPWHLLVPGVGVGVDLTFVSGRRWSHGLALADPQALISALLAAGAPLQKTDSHSQRIVDYARARALALRRWLDHPLLKFAGFPLLAALPAFRLHQYIAFGGTFGEYYTYGLTAWLLGLLIWWAAWSIGLMLYAAVLRTVTEALVLLLLYWRAPLAATLRPMLEWLGRIAFYLGVPVWLLIRMLGTL